VYNLIKKYEISKHKENN